VRTKDTDSNKSFSITTKNVACGESGITCTKAVYIDVATVRIRLILGDSPSINKIRAFKGRTTFPGGEIEYNDMFQYVILDSGAEIFYGAGIRMISS